MLVILAAFGCQPEMQPVPPPTDTSACGAAGQQLEALQCKDREGHPMWINLDGVPFKKVCEDAQQDGRAALRPECIAVAKSCAEAFQCPAQ